MSSLTTTTINTANGTTDLTLKTGNNAGPAIVVGGDTTIWVRANTTANLIVANTIQTNINSNTTVTGTLTVTGNSSIGGNVTINANGTINKLTSNTIVTVNGSVATNTFILGASSLGANGYTRLPNGLLMQWGTQAAAVNNAVTATATFPATFATIYTVQACIANSSTTATSIAAVVNAVSTTNFTWKSSLAAAAATANIFYMAIGT